MNRLAERLVDAPNRAPWVAAGAAVCGCAAVVMVDPQQNALSPPCPFQALTGWWCPFCGATRATGALLSGDVSEAFRYNAMWLVAIPFLVIGWVLWVFRGNPISQSVFRFKARISASGFSQYPNTLVGTGLVFVAFVLIRNVGPWTELLRFPGA